MSQRDEILNELKNILHDLEMPCFKSKEFEFQKDGGSMSALKIEDLEED